MKVFESPQCDRTLEGDMFIPPDPNMEYTSKLRSHIHEEKSLLERRKNHFYDKSFQVGNAGHDFPRRDGKTEERQVSFAGPGHLVSRSRRTAQHRSPKPHVKAW